MLLPRPIRWITICYPFLLSTLFISELCTGVIPAQAQAGRALEAKKVLILHSFEGNVPVTLETDQGLLTTLESGGIPRLNQFFESLDLRRNPGAEHRRLLVDQMRKRYSHRKLNMIITMYPEALKFVLKDCRDIFPHVPILALYLPERMELPKTDRRIIRHSAPVDIIGTFEIARKLVPKARRVYIISGSHEVDKSFEDQARRELKKWKGELEFYLSSMPFDDILTALSTAPPSTIILLLVYSHDIAGKGYTPRTWPSG